MELFQGHIKDYATSNLSSLTELQLLCGNKLLNGSEYVRLYYCEKNFNNIVKSYMILFDLTVVNQWHGIFSSCSSLFTFLVLSVLRTFTPY